MPAARAAADTFAVTDKAAINLARQVSRAGGVISVTSGVSMMSSGMDRIMALSRCLVPDSAWEGLLSSTLRADGPRAIGAAPDQSRRPTLAIRAAFPRR